MDSFLNQLIGLGQPRRRRQRLYSNTPEGQAGGGSTPPAQSADPAKPAAAAPAPQTPAAATTPPAGTTAPAAAAPAPADPAKAGSDTVEVDFFGESISLPVEKAKKLIAARDTTKEQKRQLEDKLAEHARQKEDAERRARAAEEASKGNLEQAERTFAEKYEQRQQTLESAVVRLSLQTALNSDPDFIGDAASTNDALLLLVNEQYQVDPNTLDVKAKDGKTVAEKVKDFLATRPHLRKAQSSRSPRPRMGQAPENQTAVRKSSSQMIVGAMAKLGDRLENQKGK